MAEQRIVVDEVKITEAKNDLVQSANNFNEAITTFSTTVSNVDESQWTGQIKQSYLAAVSKFTGLMTSIDGVVMAGTQAVENAKNALLTGDATAATNNTSATTDQMQSSSQCEGMFAGAQG